MTKETKSIMNVKVGFMPLPLYVISVVVLAVATAMGKFTGNAYTGLYLCAVFGCTLKFIVDHVSLLKKTLGGSAIAIGCAVLVYYNLIPEDLVEAADVFIEGAGMDFLTCFVMTLICGSILTMSREMLIKCGVRYFIPVIGGLICAYGLAALTANLIGVNWKYAIMYIAGPIMGGGNGAGATPMSEIYSGILGQDRGEIYSQLHVFTTLGNWVSIFFAIVLNMIGQKYQKLTGNGVMMPGYSTESSKTNYDEFSFDFSDILNGIMIVAGVFLFGRVCSNFVPSIHAYAFDILLVAVLKITGLIPKKWEFYCLKLYELVSKQCVYILSAGLGIAMWNLRSLFEALTLSNLLITFVTVLGGVIGAGLLGIVVGFYPIESSITAGLCMSNAGGNGDVYVLSACDRMELMSFAQISSRLGGAIVLVVQSMLAGILLAGM